MDFGNEVKVIMVSWKKGSEVRIKNSECNLADNTVDVDLAMSNPEGSGEDLATNSRVDETTTTPSMLSDLPLELVFRRITSQLEARDLLTSRKMHFKL